MAKGKSTVLVAREELREASRDVVEALENYLKVVSEKYDEADLLVSDLEDEMSAVRECLDIVGHL